MRLRKFSVFRNGTYPGRTVEKDPNADLNTFMERMASMVDAGVAGTGR